MSKHVLTYTVKCMKTTVEGNKTKIERKIISSQTSFGSFSEIILRCVTKWQLCHTSYGSTEMKDEEKEFLFSFVYDDLRKKSSLWRQQQMIVHWKTKNITVSLVLRTIISKYPKWTNFFSIHFPIYSYFFFSVELFLSANVSFRSNYFLCQFPSTAKCTNRERKKSKKRKMFMINIAKKNR